MSGPKKVQIGFFDTARYPDGTPVTNVAAWNEFGTQRPNGSVLAPERPFFRNAIPGIKAGARSILKKGLDPTLMVVSRQLAARVGVYGQGEVQQSITDLINPPNAPSTRQWKNERVGKPASALTNPLIDTGQLRLSVTYRVIG